MKLKTKLILTGILMTLLPLLAVVAMVWVQTSKSIEAATQESTRLACVDLDHIVKSVYSLCELQNNLTKNQSGVDKQQLRQAVMNIKVGETGYVYVLDSVGHYVISKDGKRDGEDISKAKDADGIFFIQEICKKAKQAKSGEIFEQSYPWKNAGETAARVKIARLMYYEPWDWVIGAASYQDDFHKTAVTLKALSQKGNILISLAVTAFLCGAIVIWWLIAGGITKRIRNVIDRLAEGSEQVSASAGQVSAASQSLAQGASEQAAGLEETTSSLEEMSSMTKTNAENAGQANDLASEARHAADKGNEAMGQMNQAIGAIQKSATETAKIIKVIDEIAFQTNLLALNAAVEAARAGEAGKGFAVVAEEVRNLAQRSAEAARNTASMIEESVKNAQGGVTITTSVAHTLEEITASTRKVNDLISEISAASQEQAQGIDQINTAMSNMDKVTQQNAANAEQSAGASEELTSQAAQLKEMVAELVTIVGATTHRSDKTQNRSQTRETVA